MSSVRWRVAPWALLGILGCYLQGCAWPCSELRISGKVASSPGQMWDPPQSEWYCPRPGTTSEVTDFLLQSKDHDLTELLDLALSNHPVTQTAWRQARAAAYQVGIAKSALYPTILGVDTLEFDSFKGGNVAASGGDIVTGGAALQGRSIQANIEDLIISYLVLDFGGREATVASTKHALQALNWNQNHVIQQVIQAVIQGYYTYIGAKELALAKKADLENAEMNLDATTELHNAGLAPIVDFLQAQASAENAKLALVSAENQVKITLGQLAVALGMAPSEEFGVQGFPEYFPVDEVTANIDELMAIAKTNRPDLASAYSTWLQKKEDYRVAVSSSLPTITAFVDLQRTQFLHQTGLDGYNYLGQVALNIPIFNGFYYENLIRQARENIHLAKANFDNLESFVLLDVLTSYYTFVSSKENLQYSQSYLEYAGEAYQASLYNYQSGVGSLVDLLAAQAALSNARAQRVNSRTTWATSLFNIAYATGTLNLATVARRLTGQEQGECP